MSFADRLRISRKEKGYSQEQLAESLEVSRQSITKWETGTAYPELKKLIQLSVRLDRDLDWLLLDERREALRDTETEAEQKPAADRESAVARDPADLPAHDIRTRKTAARCRLIDRIREVLEEAEFPEVSEEEAFDGDGLCGEAPEEGHRCRYLR